MSWTDEGVAAEFQVATTETWNLYTGSTTSLELSGPLGGASVRLFINPGATVGDLPSGSGAVPISDYTTTSGLATPGAASRFYVYVDSDTYFAGGGADPDFVYNVMSAVSARPASQTEIEVERVMNDWKVPYITDLSSFDPDTGGGIAWAYTFEAALDSPVGYYHPCVVELPHDQGFLMILTRRRAPRNYLRVTDDDLPDSGKEHVLSDIVAWHCDDAGFSGPGLRGPVLLVSSLDAVPHQPVRFWLGVAGATVHDRLGTGTGVADQAWSSDQNTHWLYLYHATEIPGRPALGIEPDHTDHVGAVVDYVAAHLRTDVQLMYPLETRARSEELGGLRVTELGKLPSDTQNATVMAVHGGIALKVLGIDQIMDAFDALGFGSPGSTSAEPNWTWDSGSPAVDGELRGWVRVWIAVEDQAARRVATFPRRFPAREVVVTRKDGTPEPGFKAVLKGPTDPAAGVCDGVLSLYFSTIKADPDAFVSGVLPDEGDAAVFSGENGHGIWRAAAVDGGETLEVEVDHEPGTSTVTTVHGLDFVVARLGSEQIVVDDVPRDLVTCWDLVTRSYSSFSVAAAHYGWYGEYVDPDPFVTSDGIWRVLTAGEQVTSDDDARQTLDMFRGADDGGPAERPGCAPWTDAWHDPPESTSDSRGWSR